MYSVPAKFVRTFGRKTETAGTVIVRMIPPVLGSFARIKELWYTAGGTAHTLTLMRPLGKTETTAAAAASQAVINISADPGVYSAYGTLSTSNNAIAANDYCVYQTKDGNFVVDTVASVSSLAITMTTNVPTATVAKGAPFWFFGITSDTNPNSNAAHDFFNCPASLTSYFPNTDEGEVFGPLLPMQGPKEGSSLTSAWPLDGSFEPILIHSNNASNQGYIEKVCVIYSTR